MEDSHRPELTVVTWNVLAAPWAAPEHYPADMDPALLDRTARAGLVASVLARLDADVMCLQETTPPDFDRICALLGDEYEVVAAPNGAALWSNWSTAAVPWEPNGTAVVWRRDAFAEVVTGEVVLSADGNVVTTMKARHVGSGARVRVMSVHLDADSPELRRAQLPVALAAFATERQSDSGVIDIVAGDC
ncbi:MAG: endonuclease/exonuclease/phosphatase family protein, partial [Acidimicrobiia bacterium]